MTKLGTTMSDIGTPQTSVLGPPPCCCQPIDYDDEDEVPMNDDYDDLEGRYSPKKVTFSDYDQVKLMSMESLLSAATSDASTMDDGTGNGMLLNTGSIPPKSFLPKQNASNGNNTNSTTGTRQQEHNMHSNNQIGNTPRRNQRVQDTQSSRLV